MALKIRLLTLLSTPVLALAVGCGGDVTYKSGVDGSKTAAELSDADVQAICTAAKETGEKFAENNKDALCNLTGGVAGALAGALGGGDPVAACEMAVSDCKSKAFVPEETECNPRLEGCNVTVAELETCFNDTLAATEKVMDTLAALTCTELTSQNSSNALDQYVEPASCVAIEQKCPDISFGTPAVGTSTTS